MMDQKEIELMGDLMKQSLEIGELIAGHQAKIAHPVKGRPARQVKELLESYETIAKRTAQQANQFREDTVVLLRAMSLTLTMTGNASTHREKGARLRGAIELIEDGVQKLREFQITPEGWSLWPDLFRSSFPTQHYVERIRMLEEEVKRLTPAEVKRLTPAEVNTSAPMTNITSDEASAYQRSERDRY